MISLGLDNWRPERVEKRTVLTLGDFITEPPMTAGVSVTQGSAMSVTAYWNGIQVISESIGMLDRFLYRRVNDDDRERATTHPVYKLIHDQPNPHMTPQVFWETITSHIKGWGNGYAEIEWDAGSRPRALWPITPDKIMPKSASSVDPSGRRSSIVWYEYQGQQRIAAEDILHIPGLGYDGLMGYSPVNMFRRTLGLTMAAEEFGASFFANGSWSGAAIEMPTKVSPDTLERLKASLAQDRGPQKAHRVRILEEGAKLSRPLVIPPDDAQFLETREFQIEEIARILNIPPYKLKHKQNERPGSNDETARLEYLTDTLLPITTRIEQECNRKLLPQSQRSTFYVEHLFEKILRADVNTRMSTYKSLFDMGVVTPEWIAKTENLPPPPKREAVPAPEPPAEPQPPMMMEPEMNEEQERAILSAQRALLVDAAARCIRVESKRAVQGARKGAVEFQRLLQERAEEDQDTLSGALLPALRLVVAHRRSGDAEALAREIAAAHVALSREALLGLPAKDLEAHVERLVGPWENQRALELAELALGRLG